MYVASVHGLKTKPPCGATVAHEIEAPIAAIINRLRSSKGTRLTQTKIKGKEVFKKAHAFRLPVDHLQLPMQTLKSSFPLAPSKALACTLKSSLNTVCFHV